MVELMKELLTFLWAFAGSLAALLLFSLGFFVCARSIIKWLVGRFIKRLMSDKYSENIWEMVTALLRISPRVVVENSLRAHTGHVIERPFGSPRKFLEFDNLVFSPAQLVVRPENEDVYVETRTVIGPKAKKPLVLDIPIMAGGMAFGLGLSEHVKVAIAKGTAKVGTCTNSGEGPLLPEERAAAKYYILQYSAGTWSKETETLRQADAIEIRLGQGAIAGVGGVIPGENVHGRLAELLNVPEGKQVIIPSKHEELPRSKDLKRLVDRLRSVTGGVPIGIKLAPSAWLEADLELAIRAGVDFISLDGGQAGAKAGAPILQDDFGLPTVFALTRAVRYLKQRGVKDKISLLSGGGYAVPGECLKALALGADAIYMGTALLWALTHEQVIKALPWEPPTQLAWYEGTLVDQFDIERSATYLANFLTSFVEEMKVAVRALGKSSIHDVNSSDLVALDEWTSKVTNIPLATEPSNGSFLRRPLL